MSETTHSVRIPHPAEGEARFILVVVGPGDMRCHVLPAEGAIVIGRDASCELMIDDGALSRRHARLRFGGTCTIEDLGSRNGTQVRGAALERGETRALDPGDTFALGWFTFVLVAERGIGPSAAPSSLVVEDPGAPTPSSLLMSVARSPLTVLVRGETGSGKEVLAEALHRLSGRPGPFIRLNCAALSPSLVESELFGHEKGAFTGATTAKPGLLEAAAGGTVLLDEIGELALDMQTRLLRAIEAREVLRVGSVRPLVIDVRFLAATHRDLPAEIAAGRFRLDLYYRLAVVTLNVPPLRGRPVRIAALARELAEAAARTASRPMPRLTAAAIARLQSHRWPGNVRELRNVIERAILLTSADVDAAHIVFDGSPPSEAATTTAVERPAVDPEERARIIAALDACNGNQTHAAKRLGIARSTLVTKMQIHRLARAKHPR